MNIYLILSAYTVCLLIYKKYFYKLNLTFLGLIIETNLDFRVGDQTVDLNANSYKHRSSLYSTFVLPHNRSEPIPIFLLLRNPIRSFN